LPRLPVLERQIVELRLKGRTNAEIAAELGVYDRKIRRVVERIRAMIESGRTL
jgi:hypothetical protein